MKPVTSMLIPGVSAVCALVAFIIALCCLLAGTDPNTLRHMELYTLNTSTIGPTLLKDMKLPPPDPSLNVTSLFGGDLTSLIDKRDLPTSVSDIKDEAESAAASASNAVHSGAADAKQVASDLKNNVTDKLDKAGDVAKNAVSKIVSTFVNTTIEEVNVQDFYVAHLLTYCSGDYTKDRKENLTYCSNHRPDKLHNNTAVNKTMDIFDFIHDIDLPDPVSFGMKAIALITKVISAFYILGIIFTFTTLLLCLFTMFKTSTPQSDFIFHFLNAASSTFAFFTLFLASGMVHVMIKKICGFFNEHSEHLGVMAYQGRTFAGCTWAAVSLVGLVMILSVMEVGMRMRRRGGGGGGKSMEMGNLH